MLAAIFSPDFGQAQADASKADADLRLSKRTLERLRDLFEPRRRGGKKDVEAAEDDFENKKAELQRAVGRLKIYGAASSAPSTAFTAANPAQRDARGKADQPRPGSAARPDAGQRRKVTSPCS